MLVEILGDGSPHPVGSAANRAVRDRIMQRLTGLGVDPYLQRAFVCGSYGSCGTVENIVARIFGEGGSGAVLLAAHYDSVPAGPGASDDGVGVASLLEIAGAIRSGPPLKNDVILLIDDGEEEGLLGAEAFASAHPWAADVRAVVNVEARGTSGRSFLFETSDDNSWLIDLAAANIPSPATSSLFYTVYQQLPNDTDFSVFRKYGMSGVNFAFIGDVARYHTRLDDVAHADLSSIQHQGESALAMVRALGATSLTGSRRTTYSWFDLFGWSIVRWPEAWNLPVAVVALIGSFAGAIVLRRRFGVPLRDFLRAFVWWGATWAITAVVAHGFVSLLHAANAILTSYPLHAAGGVVGLWVLALSLPPLAWALSGDWFSGKALWSAGVVWMSIAGVVLSLVLPGVAYLFIVPALAGATLGLVGLLRRIDTLVLAVPTAAAAVVMFPIACGIWDGLGTGASGVIVALASVAMLLLLPALLAIRTVRLGRAAALLCGVSLGLILGGFASPAFSASSPDGMNISFLQDRSAGKAFWMIAHQANGVPRRMRDAAAWIDGFVRPFDWYEKSPRYHAAPAAFTSAPAPRLEVVGNRNDDEGGRELTVLFRSFRGAQRGTIVLDLSKVASLQVGDQRFDPAWATARGRTRSTLGRIRLVALPPEGVRMTLSLTGSDPVDVTLLDESFGLPREGDAIVASRPAWAAPISLGDTTFVRSRTKI